MRSKLIIAACAGILAGCGGGGSSNPSFDGPQYNPKELYFNYPFDGQAYVAPSAPVVLEFSDPLEVTEDNFRFTGPDGAAVPFAMKVMNGGRNVVLQPTAPLAPISDYKVAIIDLAPDGRVVNFRDGELNFSTRPALEGPLSQQRASDTFEISEIFPDDDQFPTVDFSTFRLRTSQPLDPSSVAYGDTVSLTRSGELVPALVLSGRDTLTVDPLEDMTPGQEYVLTVSGLTSASGETLAPFERTVTPLNTKSSTGEREVLVTEAPATHDTLGCLEEGDLRTSELTGDPINCVPLISTLLANGTASKQSGDIYAELAFPPSFPDVTPLRIKRGGILVGEPLDVLIGGEVPVGFDSGAVTIQVMSDATGYLFPNPNSDSPDAAKNVRLFMDLAANTKDARANGAFTQNLMHVELVGKAIVEDGKLVTDALTVVEPRVLGVENSHGVLSFHMESYRDQENAPPQPADTVPPTLLVMDDNGEQRLSWTPGDVADRAVPGEPITLLFSEALDPLSVRPGETVRLTKGGAAESFSWSLDGNALVIQPASPLAFGVPYEISVTNGLTDLAGNGLQVLDPLTGLNTIGFTMPEYVVEQDGEDVRRAPFAMVVYPGFPCASSPATASDIAAGVQGVCLSSSSEAEQVEVDELPIVGMPSNRPIRVRFSQNMDADSLTLGTACGQGAFRVERLGEDGTCQSVVDGELRVETRALTFVPELPWEEGALYRYTLASQSAGCSGEVICSSDGLPLQTALLEGSDAKAGGPNMDILFRGAGAVTTVFQELSNLPSVDANSNFAVDEGEPRVPAGTPNPATPANATLIRPNGDGGGGLVSTANTGCGFEGTPPYTEENQIDCDSERILYLTGDLNTEILNYDAEAGGVPVVIYPTTVALSNLDATAVIGLDLDTSDGDNSLTDLPIVGGLLGGLVQTLGDVLKVLGLEEAVLGQVGNLGLVPIETHTGPNIMRVRYNEDADGNRTTPPVGHIIATPDGPVFRITFDLLFDAPELSLPLGLQHNVKSLPIDNVQLEGPLDFLPDGRLFIGLENLEPLNVDLEITLAGLPGGQVNLTIPTRGINLSYQSGSIK